MNDIKHEWESSLAK